MGWHYFCASNEVTNGPKSQLVGGKRIVVFRDEGGGFAVLDARCCHLGADLGKGTVVDGRVRCGLHGWEFGRDGVCRKIPCTRSIPAFARQTKYPVAEIAGHVFVFNRPKADYPMPFFESVKPDELIGGRPIRITLESPWPLVTCNAFEVQHFACAH